MPVHSPFRRTAAAVAFLALTAVTAACAQSVASSPDAASLPVLVTGHSSSPAGAPDAGAAPAGTNGPTADVVEAPAAAYTWEDPAGAGGRQAPGTPTVTGGQPGATAPSAPPPAPVPPRGAALAPKQFADAIRAPGTVVLDVRTPSEFAEGHLEGAKLIDFNGPNFGQEIDTLDKTRTYAVYCRSGSRSGQALKVMMGKGFESTYHLEGGILAWKRAGLPTVKG